AAQHISGDRHGTDAGPADNPAAALPRVTDERAAQRHADIHATHEADNLATAADFSGIVARPADDIAGDGHRTHVAGGLDRAAVGRVAADQRAADANAADLAVRIVCRVGAGNLDERADDVGIDRERAELTVDEAVEGASAALSREAKAAHGLHRQGGQAGGGAVTVAGQDAAQIAANLRRAELERAPAGIDETDVDKAIAAV